MARGRKRERKIKIKVSDILNPELQDVFVGVNGRHWLIKVGSVVEIPESVYEALQHAEIDKVLPNGQVIRVKRYNVEVLGIEGEDIGAPTPSSVEQATEETLSPS